ncbi:integrase [Acinetobacter baumannii]|uniref:integrase n=1 Tax=Acinetobacter baumannii TaxID=470 RepID=UPI0024DE6F1C|nr:integrase [Acinetobacter baumannii]MDK2129287.1 integrase [Acinetobacter baumannii]MDK2159982.1 integrase [Acinetobacter baumannii]MDK2167610.1 integrase [Acinetobacter baumannii]MDK2251018.1 integrase [Acinetobacter baumannii]MDK2262392.1 integrase [Acinetobacter baumannii]
MRTEKVLRKSKVIPFLTSLEIDRQENFKNLVSKAKLLKLEGFDPLQWDEEVWEITGGRLLQQNGRNSLSITINFIYPPKLGGEKIKGNWENLVKALLLLRFHSKQQNLTNQRWFVLVASYINYAVQSRNASIYDITRQDLDLACEKITQDYSESSAYGFHKLVAEFAGHLDANGLCKVLLNYKYAKQKRPNSVNAVGTKRLDDPDTLITNERVLAPVVFKVLGQLYQNVPKDHKYRFYILLLTFFACTGRRFSELSLLPNQEIQIDKDGVAYLEYFPRKVSRGNTFTPKRKLHLPSQTLDLLKEVVSEIQYLTKDCRDTALEMHRSQSIDGRFLKKCPEQLFSKDLELLNISKSILGKNSRLRREGFVFEDENSVQMYTTIQGLKQYCSHNFNPQSLRAIHIDQFGRSYFLHDLMFLRYYTMSSGKSVAYWLTVECSHSMLSTFLRYIDDLVAEYVGLEDIPEFTTHDFRHTLNTMLDEGGLSDLLQTEWFGRSDPNDTKAYQHTSPEKKALMIREQLKNGEAGGILAEQIFNLPIEIQDAVLAARVQAVHDVGTGLCTHNFSQLPCERHLQCSAECKDYVWIKDDKQRVNEQKRILAITVHAQETVRQQKQSNRVKKSLDWELHNEKKINVLTKQLKDNGVVEFDPKAYLKEISNV